MSKCFIWGAGGHAKTIAEIVRLNGFTVVGFIDDLNPNRRGENFCNSQILGGTDVLENLFASGIRFAFVGFGDNYRRIQMYNKGSLNNQGFLFWASV